MAFVHTKGFFEPGADSESLKSVEMSDERLLVQLEHFKSVVAEKAAALKGNTFFQPISLGGETGHCRE
jgi:hypothetical protein